MNDNQSIDSDEHLAVSSKLDTNIDQESTDLDTIATSKTPILTSQPNQIQQNQMIATQLRERPSRLRGNLISSNRQPLHFRKG